MHPNSKSYINKLFNQVYVSHENEKKRTYEDRVVEVEKDSSTPIVLSARGRSSKETDRHHQRIVQLIADKKNESYTGLISHTRTRLRLSLLKNADSCQRRQREAEKYGQWSSVW